MGMSVQWEWAELMLEQIQPSGSRTSLMSVNPLINTYLGINSKKKESEIKLANDVQEAHQTLFITKKHKKHFHTKGKVV